MGLPHQFFIGFIVHLPFHVEEDKDERALETVDDDERIPEERGF